MTPTPLRARWWIAALVVAFVLTALWRMPIGLVLRLAGAPPVPSANGTLAGWKVRTPDGLELAFELAPGSLLAGHYAGVVEARLEGATLTGRGGRELGGDLTIDDARFEAGVAPLAGSLGMPPSLIDGRVTVEALSARLHAGALTSLACRGMVSGVRIGHGATALALGELEVACADGAAGPEITIADVGGPLELHARVQVLGDGRFTVEGDAKARPSAPPFLAELLPQIGRRDGADGSVRFRYSDHLPGLAR